MRTGWKRALLSILCMLVLWRIAPAAQDVRLVYVGPPDGTVWHGVSLGVHEANILGKFLGQTYRIEPMSAETLLAAKMAPLPAAIVVAGDAKLLQQLSAHFAHVMVFNVANDDDALRQTCQTNLLQTIPSRRMKADAVAQWHKKHPDAKVQALAWHPDFKKFAARDLNKRFRKRYDASMDDAAWAAWAAVKMLADTVARTQTIDPSALLAYMRTELEFDGQKGVPHTFRDTGQLRQPLLLVEDGALVGEAPVRGVAKNLDSLGVPSCKEK